jgi:hypothetical protein
MPTQLYQDHRDLLETLSVAAKFLGDVALLGLLIVLNVLTLVFLRRHTLKVSWKLQRFQFLVNFGAGLKERS